MNKKQLQYLEQNHSVIRSSKGGWTIGGGVSNHGYSQLDELVGTFSFMQVLVLNVSGKIPDYRLAQWLEAAFICCSWPDPRVWCNHIGALGGDAGISAVSAVCAGTMASDSAIYGPGTFAGTSELLHRGVDAIDAGLSVGEFVEKRGRLKGRLMLPGFSHPIVKIDQRVARLKQVAAELGFSVGVFQRLAFAIHDYLQEQRTEGARHGEALNMGGFIVAFMLDQGYSIKDIERIFALIVCGGIHACYAEYSDLPRDTFLPLRCDDIAYAGRSERVVPAE